MSEPSDADFVEDNAPSVPAPTVDVVLRTLGATRMLSWLLARVMDTKALRAEQAEIERLLVSIAGHYEDAYRTAYEPVRRGEGAGGSQVDQSDSTGNVTVASRQRYLRRSLASAHESAEAAARKVRMAVEVARDTADVAMVRPILKDAVGSLRACQDRITKAMEHDGVNVLADNERVKTQTDRGIIPPPAPKLELDPYVEAQRRRFEAGDQPDALGVGPLEGR